PLPPESAREAAAEAGPAEPAAGAGPAPGVGAADASGAEPVAPAGPTEPAGGATTVPPQGACVPPGEVGLAEAVGWLRTIPGIKERTAEVIVAEIGPDMGVFATAKHLASWAGLCPGNHQSAGKRYSGRTRRGNRWL